MTLVLLCVCVGVCLCLIRAYGVLLANVLRHCLASAIDETAGMR